MWRNKKKEPIVVAAKATGYAPHPQEDSSIAPPKREEDDSGEQI
jgi:hypothetical protein